MEKKVISSQEFDKRVEMETAFLMRQEYMPKKEAQQRALKEISKEYQRADPLEEK